MRGLTLRQPWCYAITHLGKRVENRPTRPPAKLLGKRIALHAGVGLDVGYERDAVGWMAERGLWRPPGIGAGYGAIPRGAIVATAQIAGWYSTARTGLISDVLAEHGWEEIAHSPWYVGPVGILLDDVVVLPKPVPARGMQGYWPVSDADAVEVVAQEIIGRCAVEADGRVAAERALAAWAGQYPGAHA